MNSATSPAGSSATMNGSATVFAVHDIAAACDYYRDKLGFAITFEWGEPTFYVCLCRDDVQLHLVSAKHATHQPGHTSLCIFVNDVDAMHADLAKRGAKVVRPPQTHDYGMRDFDVADPDGNLLIIGMGTQPVET